MADANAAMERKRRMHFLKYMVGDLLEGREYRSSGVCRRVEASTNKTFYT
jgi:hypothetical protein